MQQYFEISDALIKSEGVIWDDHNGGSESKLVGMAALFTGKEVIPVGLHSADFFSLNRVYLKDGKVHLSSESVAGVLFPVNHRDLWECINDYNEKQVGNKFSCGTLENPMSLKPIPVTAITMTVEEFCKKTGLPAPEYPDVDQVISIPRGDLVMLEKDGGGAWLLEKVGADGARSEGSILPAPRTQAEVEEMQRLVDSGITPEEANKQILTARAVKLREWLGEGNLDGVTGVDLKGAYRQPRPLNVDFHPDDEAQEAYYRELLAQKEPGVKVSVDPDADPDNPIKIL